MLISAQSEFTNVMVLAPFRVTRLCGMRSDLNGGEKQVPDQTGGTEGWRAERLEGGKVVNDSPFVSRRHRPGPGSRSVYPLSAFQPFSLPAFTYLPKRSANPGAGLP